MSKRLKLTLRRQERGVFGTVSGCNYELKNGHGNQITSFCSEQFHAVTGFRLKPGEEKRIEIIIKEVKA